LVTAFNVLTQQKHFLKKRKKIEKERGSDGLLMKACIQTTAK